MRVGARRLRAVQTLCMISWASARRRRMPDVGRWVRPTLGVLLALLLAAPSIRADDALPPVPRIFHKARTFRIPFNVDASERARLSEVQLWWSSDLGNSWERSD